MASLQGPSGTAGIGIFDVCQTYAQPTVTRYKLGVGEARDDTASPSMEDYFSLLEEGMPTSESILDF